MINRRGLLSGIAGLFGITVAKPTLDKVNEKISILDKEDRPKLYPPEDLYRWATGVFIGCSGTFPQIADTGRRFF